MLSTTQQEFFRRKDRIGLRSIHRYSFVKSSDIFNFTKEKELEQYICKYLQKKLAFAHRTDLGQSVFYEDIFHMEKFRNQPTDAQDKQKTLGVGHLFRLKRLRKMKERHQSYLLTWLSFINQHETKRMQRSS